MYRAPPIVHYIRGREEEGDSTARWKVRVRTYIYVCEILRAMESPRRGTTTSHSREKQRRIIIAPLVYEPRRRCHDKSRRK